MVSPESLGHPAEIPVTVHSSRTTQGVRVHEEARTVSLMPDGAVVRLKAELPPGELIVLTNEQTKLRVVCRVKFEKRSADNPNDINLEFIQAAPGFWGDAVSGEENGRHHENVPLAAADNIPDKIPEKVSDPVPQIFPQPDAMRTAASPTPKARVIAPRKPVWRQTSEAPAIERPVAEPRGFSSPANEPPPASARLAHYRPPTPQPLSEQVFKQGLRGPKLLGDRSSGLRTGVLVMVAAVSIANGVLMGAWIHKQLTDPGATQSAPAQQSRQSDQTPGSRPDNVGISTAGSTASPASAPLASSSAATARQTLSSVKATVETVAVATPSGGPRSERDQQSDQPPSITPSVAADQTDRSPSDLPLVTESRQLQPEPVSKLQLPRRKNALIVVQGADLPAIGDGGRGFSQVGAESGILTATASSPAPPPPSVGGQFVPMRLISSPPAPYPAAALNKHIEGVVTMDVLVDETGKVTEAKVIFGHPALQDAARAALQNWRYEPARMNGQPIAMRAKVSIRFDLK